MRLSTLSTLIIAVTTATALPAASENKGNIAAPDLKCETDSDCFSPDYCLGGMCHTYPGIPGVKREEHETNHQRRQFCRPEYPECPGVKRDQNDYPPSGKPCSDSSDCEEKLEFCNPNMGKCVTKPHFG